MTRTTMALLLANAIWLSSSACAQTASGEQPEVTRTKQRPELVRFNKERLRFQDKAWYQYLAKHRKTTPVIGIGQRTPRSWVGESKLISRKDWEAHRLRQQFLSENLVHALMERKVQTETRLTEFPAHIRDAVHELLSMGDVPKRGNSVGVRELLTPQLVTIQLGKNQEIQWTDSLSGITTVQTNRVVLVRAGVATHQFRSIQSKTVASKKETTSSPQ